MALWTNFLSLLEKAEMCVLVILRELINLLAGKDSKVETEFQKNWFFPFFSFPNHLFSHTFFFSLLVSWYTFKFIPTFYYEIFKLREKLKDYSDYAYTNHQASAVNLLCSLLSVPPSVHLISVIHFKVSCRHQ